MLIVIEGIDGSGKATYSQRLYMHLQCTCENHTQLISYPHYDAKSSIPLKMYLNGDFGTDPTKMNPYMSASLYAIDHYLYYRDNWKFWYNRGDIIISDRYVTSNLIYSAANADYKNDFRDWVKEYEYGLLKLPKPDLIIYLDMPVRFNQKFIADRVGKTGGATGDIHEANAAYLNKVNTEAVEYFNQEPNAVIVPCYRNGEVRSMDEIFSDIVRHVQNALQ